MADAGSRRPAVRHRHPADRRRCGRRWPRPRSATTSTARTRRSTRWRREVAALFGHEAALFTPTGSMANQIALQLARAAGRGAALRRRRARRDVRDRRGRRDRRHLHPHLAGRSARDIDADAVAAMIRPAGYHAVPTRAIAVEQTHNRGGGGVIPLATLRALRAVADDGRRRAALRRRPDLARARRRRGAARRRTAALFDTLSVCLSKGLGAPVGSLVVGIAPSGSPGPGCIRKRLGGGMRQVGILAAAGRYALRPPHRPAGRRPRPGPAGWPRRSRRSASSTPAAVRTNIVPLDLTKAALDAPHAGRGGRARRACWSRCWGRGPPAWSPTWTSTTPDVDRRSTSSPRIAVADHRGSAARADRDPGDHGSSERL